jgi:hypothetical protein
MPGQLLITQEPMFKFNAASQPLVYTLRAEDTVLNESNVKFICQIWGGRTLNDFYKLATLKTTPNGAGVGMFDISTIIESYVSPTYQGKRGTDEDNPNGKSTFKNVWWKNTKPHTIHQIDKFCTNTKNLFLYEVYFGIEYLDAVTGEMIEDANQTDYRGQNIVYNGVLMANQNLTSYAQVPDDFARFGYQPQDFNYDDGTGDYLIRDSFGTGASYTSGGKFVTNMPSWGQKIREDDYLTVAFFNCIDNRNHLNANWNGLGNLATCPTVGGGGFNNIPGIALRFKDANGVVVQNNYYENEPINGGASQNTGGEDVAANLIYFGAGLANMKGRGETWPASACNYDVYPSDGTWADAPDGGWGGGSGEEEEDDSGGGTLAFRTSGEDSESDSSSTRTDPCECERCVEEPYIGKWKWCDDGACIYDSEKDCLDNHGEESWDCIDCVCQDPGTGLGQYPTLGLCQSACCPTPQESWDCKDGVCSDPGTGLGQYPTQAACQLACSHVTPSWDCVDCFCVDPGTGGGAYSTLSACEDVCCPQPPGPCDCKECEEPKNKWRCDDGTFYGPCIYDSLKDCERANPPEPPEPPHSWYKPIGRIYNFGIIASDCHGFETVRLTWQNRMGAWDYYSFTKKSTKKVKTKGVTYNQLAGTWNESIWQPHDHLGGNKIFLNKTKTSYDLNTDYVTEEIAEWFEELFTSSDVYLMEEFSNDEPVPNFGGVANPPNYLKKYIQPVTVGSKSYTKKTRANDELIKYKFKVDLCIPNNIQRA